MTSPVRPIVLAVALLAGAPAHAELFQTLLSGPQEAPPNASPGTGTAQVDFNLALHRLNVNVGFANLLSTTTASHIHCCTANPPPLGLTQTAIVATAVPTFPGFPLGVTAGTYSQTFDTSLAATWNPAFITANGGTIAGAEAALAQGLLAGTAYLNVHSAQFPGGEIRGFLAAVPEPSSIALLGLGMLGLGAMGWRRRRTGTE